ncbi:MAG: carboxypeptidase regulatory-like domain-containing protein, partial [Candidatus Hydrogenedentes bacterium]|nr:carboxypeptidase regulatory-like domain-containing protein [Candidatus Hydrogenedentota bacterium]
EQESGASIAGVVVDSHGNPVVGSNVTAVLVDPVQPKPRYRASVTDAKGAFKIDGVEAGPNLLRANRPQSYASSPPVSQEVRVGEGEAVTGVRIVADFDPGVKIAGHVRDTSGKPIGDATLWVQSAGGNGSDRQTRSGPDGSYEIGGLREGMHRMQVNHANYSSFTGSDVEAPNPSFDIVLRGKATIEGSVLDARSGKPVKEFSVVVLRGVVQTLAPGAQPGEAQSIANPEGRFVLHAEENGSTLLVRAKGYAPELHPIPAARENETIPDVIVRLKTGGVVDGIVVNESGERVAGAQVYVGRMPQSWELQQHHPGDTTSDAEGAFRLESLSGDAVTICAVHENYAATSATVTPIPGGAPTKLQIVLETGGTIEGTVRVNGVPESGYQISLHLEDGYQNATEVDPNGEFEFTGLPDGVAFLSLNATRSGTQRRGVSKQASVELGKTTTVDFDLIAGTAVLEGTVTLAGQPLSNATVELLIEPNLESREGMRTTTDPEGKFRFENLPLGTAALMVRADPAIGDSKRMKSYRVELENDRTTRLDIELGGAMRLNGRVSGIPEGWRAEIGLVRGTVEIPPEASIEESILPSMDKIAGGGSAAEDGSFALLGIEPGEYTVIVVASDPKSEGQTARIATQPITIKEGDEPYVEFTLE